MRQKCSDADDASLMLVKRGKGKREKEKDIFLVRVDRFQYEC